MVSDTRSGVHHELGTAASALDDRAAELLADASRGAVATGGAQHNSPVTEAGGAAMHLSGEGYTPLSPNQITIVAATPELAETIRALMTDD